jgi:hypothetical protein
MQPATADVGAKIAAIPTLTLTTVRAIAAAKMILRMVASLSTGGPLINWFNPALPL